MADDVEQRLVDRVQLTDELGVLGDGDHQGLQRRPQGSDGARHMVGEPQLDPGTTHKTGSDRTGDSVPLAA